jgi:hypothetical protein
MALSGMEETLTAFIARQPQLTLADRTLLVEQAILLAKQFYVHLPRKRVLRGIDPIRRLELLQAQLPAIGPDLSFHAALCETLAELHDLHTVYVLPGDYGRAVAVLPFAVGCYGHGAARRYLVVSAQPGMQAEGLAPGVEVTHWNGLPITHAIDRLAWGSAGASTDAQYARAVCELTLRPLATLPPPEEAEIFVGYRDLAGVPRTIRAAWRVLQSGDPRLPTDRSLHGLDVSSDLRRGARDRLRHTAPAPDDEVPTLLPDLFRARRRVGSAPIGYLRIRSFRTTDAAGFVAEFARLLALLPPDGLLLDVRDNGGGLVEAAERSLQLLAPGPVTPVGFQLLANDATAGLCRLEPELAPWVDSIDRAVRAGDPYSDPLPITDPVHCNDVGRTYHGPVVLLIDPLCYSACDVFAAGFADNNIGEILGVGSTGGGGANVWPQSKLVTVFDRPGSPFRPLPGGSGLRVAVRRALRIGPSLGVEIEEQGIAPTTLHVPTKRDLLENDADLLAKAVTMLRRAAAARAG